MVSKVITAIFVICVLFAVVSAGGDSMSIVVNRLMLEGYTEEQINEMKAYPQWPTYDLYTGEIINGSQKWVSHDGRIAIIYSVSDSPKGKVIKKQVLYDHSSKTKK